MARKPVTLLVAVIALILLVALPVLAGRPSSPPGLQKAKVAQNPITISGVVETTTDEDGKTVYTLTVDGTTYTLHAGPPWFFGDNYPLQPFVGKSVTIDGEIAEGTTEVDVLAVDGQEIRAAGRPPWAGGWQRVGERHPGWSQDKADRFQARFGDCFPPGHCKDAGADEE
jgi:hypothetical protein